MRTSTLIQFAIAAAALVSHAAAHPGHDHPMEAHEFHRRQVSASLM